MNVIGFLVAEGIDGDASGVREVGALLHESAVARMPFTWPADVLLVVIEWEGSDAGTHMLALRLRAPGGAVIETRALDTVVAPNPGEPAVTSTTVASLRGLSLVAFGVYTLELLIDDQVAGLRRFQFVPIVAGEPTRALRIVRE